MKNSVFPELSMSKSDALLIVRIDSFARADFFENHIRQLTEDIDNRCDLSKERLSYRRLCHN